MQVRTTRTGEVVGVGSIDHTELARLQAAAKKSKPKDEPKPAPAPKLEPKPVVKLTP